MRLIHLTDPHLSSLQDQRFGRLRGKRRSGFLSWKRKRRYVHRLEVLEPLTQAVERESADLVLLTGDLVHIGLESEIIQVRGWLERLGPPAKVMLLPGNHDHYAGDSLRSMQRHWGDYLPYRQEESADYTSGFPEVRTDAGIRLIGLNSSCTTPLFCASGELGDRQLLQLDRELDRNRHERAFQVVLLHHPPIRGITSRRKALRDDRKLESLFRKHSPEVVLYGHLHRNLDHRCGSTRIFCTESASSVHGASYRVLDIDPNKEGWNCRMRLVSMQPGDDGRYGPVEAGTSSWSVSA